MCENQKQDPNTADSVSRERDGRKLGEESKHRNEFGDVACVDDGDEWAIAGESWGDHSGAECERVRSAGDDASVAGSGGRGMAGQ